MDAYTIAILRRPASAPQLSEAELDVLQAEHVAFNGRMREAIPVTGTIAIRALSGA